MRALLLILLVIIIPLSDAYSCTDGDYYEDKCDCDNEVTDVMPCISNKNDHYNTFLGTVGKKDDHKQRSFFIHKNECLGAMGVNRLSRDSSMWPTVRTNGTPLIDQYRQYQTKDEIGLQGACTSGYPAVNERMMIIRNGTSQDNVSYVVRKDSCAFRRLVLGYIPGDNFAQPIEDDAYRGLCSLAFDYDDPDGNQWFNNTHATFKSGEVGTVSSSGTLNGGISHWIGGDTVRVIKIEQGQSWEGIRNTSHLNWICAYVVSPNSTDPLINPLNWDLKSMGCVDEPPLPGPNVYNKTLPSTLTPYVDTSICMDSTQVGRVCDKTKTTLVARGSTFDKPMIVMSTGLGSTGVNILELRYQFEGDYDPSIKTCGSFTVPGFDPTLTYCAQLNPYDTSTVCACIKGGDYPAPNNTITNTDLYDEEIFNICGKNPFIQCVDRPTLEHSQLKMIPQYVEVDDLMRGRKIPAVKPIFVQTRGGDIAYVDKQNRDVCLSKNNNKYYVCDASFAPTTTPAVQPLNYKRKLALPRDDFYIREYYIHDVFKGTNCVDSIGNEVYYDYDQRFYLMLSGKLSTQPANGTVKCRMPNLTGGSTLTTITTDMIGAGIARDTGKYVYALNLSAMIPDIKPDKTIHFERYTGPKDDPRPVKQCIPYLLTDICDPYGTTSYYPGGVRDRTECPNIQPIDPIVCAPYGLGDNNADALFVNCPGIYKGNSGAVVNSICLNDNSGWPDDTIANYNNSLAYRSPLDAATDCHNVKGTDLCVAIGSTCGAVTSRNRATGLALWPAIHNGDAVTSTCDASLGLINTRTLTLDLPNKIDYCAKITKVGSECDAAYVAYTNPNGMWTSLQNYMLQSIQEIWDRSKNFTDTDITNILNAKDSQTNADIYDATTKYLFGKTAVYTTQNPQRSCFNNSATYDYPCIVVDPCVTINVPTQQTGYATWLPVPDVQLTPPPALKVPDAVVEQPILGTCMTNKYPATGTEGPTRTCKLVLNESGDVAYAFWKNSVITNPCVDTPPPPPQPATPPTTGVTGGQGSTEPAIIANNCTAITSTTPIAIAANGFANWATVPVAVTQGDLLANSPITLTATGTCAATYVKGSLEPTRACIVTKDNNDPKKATANWVGPVSNPCITSYTPPTTANYCTATTTPFKVWIFNFGNISFPTADASITPLPGLQNGTVDKLIHGTCPNGWIASASTPISKTCRITLDSHGYPLRADWLSGTTGNCVQYLPPEFYCGANQSIIKEGKCIKSKSGIFNQNTHTKCYDVCARDATDHKTWICKYNFLAGCADTGVQKGVQTYDCNCQ